MIRVITAPTSYPLTLAEAKAHARVTSSSEDGVLTMLLAAATEYAEHLTGRAYVERTLEWAGTYFPQAIDLPFPPLLSIVSVTYTDTAGAAQTVAASNYEVDTVSQPGRISIASTYSWPTVGNYVNPARVRYRAGYVPSGSPTDTSDRTYLPAVLRQWIAARIATLYDDRGHIIERGNQIPADFADRMLDPLVIGSRLF